MTFEIKRYIDNGFASRSCGQIIRKCLVKASVGVGFLGIGGGGTPVYCGAVGNKNSKYVGITGAEVTDTAHKIQLEVLKGFPSSAITL